MKQPLFQIVSEIPYITNHEMSWLYQRKEKNNLNNEFCQEQAFPYILHIGKFGYKDPQDNPVSPAGTLIKARWILIST